MTTVTNENGQTVTTVNNGETVNNVDITNTNALDVSAGGTANNTTVDSGGFLAVEGTSGGLAGLLGGIFGPKNGGVANGVTVNNGGLFELRGSNSSASNIVLNGGGLVIDTTASVTGSLTFEPASSQNPGVTLDGDDNNFKPTLVGFSASSSISDNAVHFPGATLTTTVSDGNTIATLSGNGVTNTFTFAGTPQLMIVPDNGNDGGPEAVIVTTDTITDFEAVPTNTLVSHASTTPALTTGQAAQPAMSFLSHGQAADVSPASPASPGMSDATPALAATKITAATQSLGAIAHAMTLSQGHDLGRSMLGDLPNPTGLTSVEARTAIGAGALQHVATAVTTPALMPHHG